MGFKQFFNESLLQQVTDKFKGMIKEIPEEFSYEVSINGLTVKSGIHNVTYIPKKDADDLELLQKGIAQYRELASQKKKVEISQLDAEIKKLALKGKDVSKYI